MISKDSAKDDTTGFSIESSEETSGVLQVNAGGYLLGFRTRSLEETDESSIPAVVKREAYTREVNLGWVPEMGWSLTFIAMEKETTEGTEKTDETTYFALLAFIF